MEARSAPRASAPGRKQAVLAVAAVLATAAVAGFLLAAPQPEPDPTLQALIDAVPAGGTLRLEAREYRGPARIERPLTLDGGGRAILAGPGRGTVLVVAGRGVTVRGLRIRGSGDLHDHIDSGLQVEGDDHRIVGNAFEDVLFGIHLKQATRTVVRGNSVRGKDLPLGVRGDAIRLWNSRGNLIEDNDFERARDLTVTGSPDNLIAGNRFRDGRYGLHAIFSPRLRVEGNAISDTGTGIVVLYSPDVILRGNRIAHALEGGGAGIVFKESNDALVEGNDVLHCAVGLKVDASPQAASVLTARGNRFAHNIVGLFFYGDAGGHVFTGNRFEKNLTQVALSAPGVASANVWRGNHWDDYEGFDRNADGIGDTAHELWMFADRIWMETPMSTFFRNSPAFELLDFLERLAPFSTPHRILRDDAPARH